MKHFQEYLDMVNLAIATIPYPQHPKELYDPIAYHMALGGKRFAGGKVISWDEKPENIGTVKFRSVPGERRYAFVAKDDGLYTMSGMVILVK